MDQQWFEMQAEGKVSKELLASQMQARPARTLAPEKAFRPSLEDLDKAFLRKTGQHLFLHDTSTTDQLFSSIHRFRATDQGGLVGLAKDLARLTADRIDADAIQRFSNPLAISEVAGEISFNTHFTNGRSQGNGATVCDTYELRLRDAHIPSHDMDEAYALVGIDPSARPIDQGFKLIAAVVSVMFNLNEIMRQ